MAGNAMRADGVAAGGRVETATGKSSQTKGHANTPRNISNAPRVIPGAEFLDVCGGGKGRGCETDQEYAGGRASIHYHQHRHCRGSPSRRTDRSPAATARLTHGLVDCISATSDTAASFKAVKHRSARLPYTALLRGGWTGDKGETVLAVAAWPNSATTPSAFNILNDNARLRHSANSLLIVCLY